METIPEAKTIETCLARSTVYHEFSMLLRHPDAGTVKWLATKEYRRLPEIVERLHHVDGHLHNIVQHLIAMLDRITILEWTKHYERIFGHAVQGTSPPYELEYGEEHSHRQPQELGDIAAFYTAFGLEISADAHERVDHIVTECEFMHYLLYKQACALDEGAEEQAKVCEAAVLQFLADHLGRWGPAFALRLSRATDHGLFTSVADLILTWLIQECTHMQIAVGSFDLPLRLPKDPAEVECAACMMQKPGSGDHCG